MKLFITTPITSYQIDRVSLIEISTKDGQITILPDHMKLVTSMLAGLVSFVNSNNRYEYFIGDAIIMFENNEIKIITDYYTDIQKIEDLDSFKNSLNIGYYIALESLVNNKHANTNN
jgi:F-type H+-transporting ATPase subunit epsilon